MIPRRTIIEFEYLGEFEMEIKNILGHESWAHMGLIYEKTRGQNSRATVPLKWNLRIRSNSSFYLGQNMFPRSQRYFPLTLPSGSDILPYSLFSSFSFH